MRKIIALLAGCFLLVMMNTGCQSSKPMDDATIMAKADSAAKAQMQAIADSAMKSCDANKAAWIQMKADSIYKADSAAMAMAKK